MDSKLDCVSAHQYPPGDIDHRMVAPHRPPPFPMVPFLIAAGALQYSRKKFLGALALGRGIRFFVIAFLGQVYGKAITSFFSKYYKPALFTLIGLAVLGGVLALVEYLRMRRKPRQSPATSRPKAA